MLPLGAVASRLRPATYTVALLGPFFHLDTLYNVELAFEHYIAALAHYGFPVTCARVVGRTSVASTSFLELQLRV